MGFWEWSSQLAAAQVGSQHGVAALAPATLCCVPHLVLLRSLRCYGFPQAWGGAEALRPSTPVWEGAP